MLYRNIYKQLKTNEAPTVILSIDKEKKEAKHTFYTGVKYT